MIRNPRFVAVSPLLAMVLLENGNLNQIIRMWTERSAEGQSIIAWLSVNAALCLFLNFYIATDRNANRWAIFGTRVGIILNACVILSVAYFRWVAA